MSRKPSRQPCHLVRREATTRQSDPVLAAARAFWQLPDNELDRLLSLSREADQVELKVTVPEPAHDAICAALGVDFARVRAHRVYYLDTKDRTLHRHGAANTRLPHLPYSASDAAVTHPSRAQGPGDPGPWQTLRSLS